MPENVLQKRERISREQAWMLRSVALFFDVIQASTKLLYVIPFIGFIAVPIGILISIAAAFTFWLWFALLDAGGIGKHALGKLLLRYGSQLIEFIPILNALPGWIVSTEIRIQMVKHEDREYNEEQARATEQAVSRIRQQQQKRRARNRNTPQPNAA